MKNNEDILKEREIYWNKIKKPRVGDFIIMENEPKPRRISHVYEDGIQTTFGGSFYLGKGYMSYSGGLEPFLSNDRFKLTDQMMIGSCWFFDRDIWGAGRGKYFNINCRVYKESSNEQQ